MKCHLEEVMIWSKLGMYLYGQYVLNFEPFSQQGFLKILFRTNTFLKLTRVSKYTTIKIIFKALFILINIMKYFQKSYFTSFDLFFQDR